MADYTISKTRTFYGYLRLMFGVFLVGGAAQFIAAGLISLVSVRSTNWSLLAWPILLGGGALLFITQYYRAQTRLETHRKALNVFAEQNGWPRGPAEVITHRPYDLGGSSLERLPSDGRLMARGGITLDPKLVYQEYSYEIWRSDRSGSHVAEIVHYASLVAELPRELPNVFFDSIKARGKQFHIVFNPKQRHSLEGNFDESFVTYFPTQYTIDSMSFISPDVMHALQQADAYDVEIVGNKLYMYGALRDPTQQIPDMRHKLAAIREQLLNNILTYRDERLPYQLGRERVMPLAMALQGRKRIQWVTIFVIIVWLLSYIVPRVIENVHIGPL